MPSRQLPERAEQFLALAEGVRKHTVRRVKALSLARACNIVRSRTTKPTLVLSERADEEALAELRASGISYFVEATDEAYLAPIQIRGPRQALAELHPFQRAEGYRNPFAIRASRVSRLLLLHPQETFTVSGLSESVDLDESVVSRTLSALAREGLVDVRTAAHDQRMRSVTLREPRRLLNEWESSWRRQRPVGARFDIGTRSVADTLRVIDDAAEPNLPYAISGLAGAAQIARVVEPADVLLLTRKVDVGEWKERLMTGPPAVDRGLLRLVDVRDDFILELASRRGRSVVADPVQLWLDTASSGERSRDASEAIAMSMSW